MLETRFTVRLDPKMLAELNELAGGNKASRSALVRKFIQKGLKEARHRRSRLPSEKAHLSESVER